jgi:hypothetical protein
MPERNTLDTATIEGRERASLAVAPCRLELEIFTGHAPEEFQHQLDCHGNAGMRIELAMGGDD